jgi:hypothetical protein
MLAVTSAEAAVCYGRRTTDAGYSTCCDEAALRHLSCVG